jgi:phage/plasmid-associated DNA primase
MPATAVTQTEKALETFDIRNFIDNLEPNPKSKGKYICPVCGGNNLAIDERSGKYQCFNGCECAAIREAIKPWAEVMAEKKGSSTVPKRAPFQKKVTPKNKPVPFPGGELTLVRLPEPATNAPQPQEPQFTPDRVFKAFKEEDATLEELKQITVTTYDYGNGQKIHRFDVPCVANEKGRIKSFAQSHVSDEGKNIWKKGDNPWSAYRLSEIIENACTTDGIPVLLLQEGEGCVEFARGASVASFTFQGGNWGNKEINTELQKIKDALGEVGIAFLHDSDEAGIKKANIVEKCCNEVGLAFLGIDPRNIYPELPCKGDIKEILDAMEVPEFIRRLEEQIHAAVKERCQQQESFEETDKNNNEKPKPKQVPPADIFARELAEQYKDKFRWNNEHKSWMEYEKVQNGKKAQLGIWTSIDSHTIECEIQNVLELRGIEGYGSDSYIQNIRKFLARKLNISQWNERENILPFKDGIVHIATGKFEKHSPENYLTWCLPREYNDNSVFSDWGTIRAWLQEATEGRIQSFKIFTHFAAAVLRGRHDLQKVLYLWGDGGSGKGTYTRLLESVIGEINCWSGKIESLDDLNQAASLLNKKLAIFADQDKIFGKLQTFKNLTGGDKISAKLLYKDPFQFKFKGLSLITANHAVLQGGGIGSWFKRRVIPEKMNITPTKVEDLDTKFKPEIAAFTKYLLSISDEEINATLRDGISSEQTDCNFWEMAIRQDSLASWVNEHIIFDANSQTRVGANKHECLGEEYHPIKATLFGSYHRYCHQGNLQGKSINNFPSELEEILKKVLRHPEVSRIRNREGSFFEGIRLRTLQDDIPTPLESLFPTLPNCDDPCDDPVTTSVTTSNPCSDQCDDLLTKKSFEDFDAKSSQGKNSDAIATSNPGKVIEPLVTARASGRHTPNSTANENTPNPKSDIYIGKECIIQAGGTFDGQQAEIKGYDQNYDEYQVISEGVELWFKLDKLQIKI